MRIPNTFGFDVKAAVYAEYHSVEELEKWIAEGRITSPFLHIGCGSNLLFVKDYEGMVLHSCIGGMEVTAEDDGQVHVRVGAGVVWDDFAAYCVEQGWYGAENLSLIPGEVGAAAVQNIGAYGVEAKDLIESVETVNIRGEKRVYRKDECEYAYRKSLFKKPEMKPVFVTYVNFVLSKKEHYTLDYGTIRQELAGYPSVNLATLRRVIIDIRESKLPDPKVLGNAGSFFMNPIVPRAQFEALLDLYPAMPHYEVDAGTGEDSRRMDDRPMRLERQGLRSCRRARQAGSGACESGRCDRKRCGCPVGCRQSLGKGEIRSGDCPEVNFIE